MQASCPRRDPGKHSLPASGVSGPLQNFDTRGPKSNVVSMQEDLKTVLPCLVMISAISDDCSLRMRCRQVVRKIFWSRRMDRLEYHYSWAMITHKDSEQPIEEG